MVGGLLTIESGAGFFKKAERSCLPQGSCELNCAWLTGSQWPSKTNMFTVRRREKEFQQQQQQQPVACLMRREVKFRSTASQQKTSWKNKSIRNIYNV